MRFLIKLASRGRPVKFMQAMTNIYETINTNDFLIIVSVDEDDSEMVSMIPDINRMKNAAGYIGKPWGKVAAINRDVSLYIPWDILVNVSDDMVFKVKGWDDIIKSNAKSVWGESTDFFYHCNDSHVGERLPTMAIMGREYFERFGYIYHPAYRSVSCDAEQYYVALTLGKHHYFEEKIVEHIHPVNVKSTKYDLTYKVNDQYADQDTATYFKRMKQNFYIHNAGKTVFDKHKR